MTTTCGCTKTPHVFRRSESKQTALRSTADKYRMDFLVFDMEISLVQPNVSFISLAFSYRGIVLCYVYINRALWTMNTNTHFDSNISLVLENAY